MSVHDSAYEEAANDPEFLADMVDPMDRDQLDKNEIQWLRSLCRMDIRKRQAARLTFQRKAEQTEEEFQAFLDHFDDALRFKEATLTHLEELQRALSGHTE